MGDTHVSVINHCVSSHPTALAYAMICPSLSHALDLGLRLVAYRYHMLHRQHR
jgi:hypothetical protein